MASEPGSGQPERLHPFFTAARTGPNDGNQATMQPQPYQDELQEQDIPIDPAMLEMDSYQTVYQQPDQYAMPPGPYDQSWAAPAVPTTMPMPGYEFPSPDPIAVLLPAAPNPISTTIPKPVPAPIPLEKNAFARLQAKKKPVDKAPALDDKVPTPAPEPKKRGRPPKKSRQSVGQSVSETSAPAADGNGNGNGNAVTVPANPPSGTNPLQIMMTRAANPGSAPSTPQRRLEVKCDTTRISQTVSSILEGKHRVLPPTPVQVPKPAPAKKAHPLFAAVRSKQSSAKAQMAGGSASKASSSGPGPHRQYTSTPCSPKRARTQQSSGGFRMPQFGNSNGILRVPGACTAAWPCRDNVHVRPEDHAAAASVAAAAAAAPALPYRKRKGNAICLRQEDSLLSHKLKHLSIAAVVDTMKDATGEHFPPPPPELRLPRKHVESGTRLKSRIAPQLRSDHPGLVALSESIPTALSAFDRYSNEAAMWTQKYAPSCAVEVLQSGDEPMQLRNWLEALRVIAVDTGAGDATTSSNSNSNSNSTNKAKPKKKRRKNKMNGFIVSSDDDDDDDGNDNDYDELVDESEDETLWTASGKYGKLKKTVVRPGSLVSKNGRAAARLNNVVVISGPHGSGKSAAVYAVAKELGFEVFEIGAGSRRAGKDVTDRIGNMTTNHLVQHKKKAAAAATQKKAQDESTSDLEDCDGDDDPAFPATPEPVPVQVQPKQQTMGSFFKPKNSSTAAAAAPQPLVSTGDAKVGPTEQKQSLILLEEADILYEEDKQFWTTVNALSAQSKRPFVITCTDETLIPLRLLRLHAIFRFTAPPVDPAVDRLLLVAASEGHALKREAAQSLFEARDRDLRASLTELQLWCQIAVGAKASRFDWFIPRQPAGIDRDRLGHTKRVVSENTYRPGMGWLSHDVTMCRDGQQQDKEDDFVQQAWSDWQLDMGQWQDTLDLTAWAGGLDAPTTTTTREAREDRLRLLEAYGAFTDTMSDADMVSHKVFATGNDVDFDATEPEHPPGGPDEYPVGMSLLDRTVAAHENDRLRLPLATSLRCLAKAALRKNTAGSTAGTAGNTEQSPHLAHVDAAKVMGIIHREHADAQQRSALVGRPAIARIDFAEAFDCIAVKDTGAYAVSSLEPSVFDRNMQPIVVDVAPYVRSIVAHDEHQRQQMRQKHSTFLSEAATSSTSGGIVSSDGELSEGPLLPPGGRRRLKRMRTTRTALSALEGGSRSSLTRNGSWFTADVNARLVMKTAGPGWGHAAGVEMAALRAAAAKADEEAAAARAQAAQAQAAQAAMVSTPAFSAVPAVASAPGYAASIAPYPGPVLAPAPPYMMPAVAPMVYMPGPVAPMPAQAVYDGQMPQVYGQNGQMYGQNGQQYGQGQIYGQQGQVYDQYGQYVPPHVQHVQQHVQFVPYDPNGYHASTPDGRPHNPPVDPAQQLA